MAFRLLRAAAIATALAFVLATRVFTGFDGVRVRLVEAPIAPVAGTAQADAGGAPRIDELRPPFAVIVRIRNDAASADHFAIQVDGQPVCAADVDAGVSRRVDCAMVTGWNPSGVHHVAVLNPSATWTLDYFELATHHGGSTGFTDLRIVPAGSVTPIRVTPLWVAIGWLIIAAMCLLPPAPALPRAGAIIYTVLTAFAVLCLAAMAILPWVTPYAAVVSAATFWRWLGVMVLPRFWYAVRPLVRAVAQRQSSWVHVVSGALVATVVFGAYEHVVARRLRDSFHDNYSGLLRISRIFFDGNPLFEHRADIGATLEMTSDGYDAQFMYAATFDPFLWRFHNDPAKYRLVVDAAPYRYGRIGFSLLTKVFAAGDWRRYPVTMIWLILGAEFLAAFSLSVIAQRAGASPLWGAAMLVVPGFSQSLQFGLPEPVAAAALVTGYLCVLDRRWALAGVLFAVSLLVRETGAIFVVCVGVAAFLERERAGAFRVAMLSLAPLVLWRLYVGWMLRSVWGAAAFFYDPHDLGAPLGGFVDLWRRILHGTYYSGSYDLTRAGLSYPVLLVAGFALALTLAIRKPSAASLAAVAYGLVAISLNFSSIWVHVGNGQRGTYELFVMLALVSVDIATYPRLMRAGMLVFWTLAAVYAFYGAFDAPFIRDALLS